jgi:hypothetical protein
MFEETTPNTGCATTAAANANGFNFGESECD